MEHQIDLEYLRQLMGGDEEMVARFVELFKTEMPRQMAALEAHLNAGDFANANVTAHAIKGQWQMVGREDLAGIAREIEEKTEGEFQENESQEIAKGLKRLMDNML